MRAAAPALLLLAALGARAHALDPALLQVRETGAGRVEALWKRGAQSEAEPVFPVRCRELGRRDSSREGERIEVRVLDCASGLAGGEIGVRALAGMGEDALLRVELADGRAFSAVLRPGAELFAIPAAAQGGAALRGYVALGVEHIALGFDHLLFVLGLFLLAGSARRIAAAVTAFTAAHSLTLSLAALGFVHLPAPPVEACIALSVALLAAELARGEGRSFLRQRPWTGAFAFGLLHGLGFAGGLAELGLPPREVPLALFGFNAGVELGQLAFVAVLALLAALVRPPRRVLAYAMGTAAMFLCADRVAAFFG
jgi:hydrogenase/urease accessory protein HupE